MVSITRNITTVNRTKGVNTKKYIVIHYTGNKTDGALANANYFKSVNRGASAHYFVDKTSIYQCVEDNDAAWAVGVNYGKNNLFNTVKNRNSISIEMCSNGGKIANETYKNTVELTRYLMKKYGIPANHVVRHWDVCSKACPGWNGWGANGCDASIWNQFKKDIANGTVSTPTVVNSGSTSNTSTSSSSVLKVGNRGAAVQDVQKKLVALGYNVGSTGADGIFGNSTKNAVIKFQGSVGISKDGIVGSQTLTKLNEAYNNRNKGQSVTSTTSYVGKDYVRKAQVHISNFTGTAISSDGIIGTETRKGIVKCLQRSLNLDYKSGLAVDGCRGNATNVALGNHYVKRAETQYLVTFVEIGLMALNYYNGSVESPGVFGGGLETAVRNFQKANGLVCDGIAGKGTILKILACLGC
mgnify:CR=1 FL=1